MSLVVVEPEALAAAASDLTSLGSAIGGANATAAAQTTGLLAAGADEVSTAIAALFGAHGQAFQVASARAAAFHQEFVQALTAGAGSYATVEAAAASRLQSVLDPINAQAQAATGGAMGSIYRAIQQANEKLLIGFTNVVGRLEQPLVPFFEGLFGPPVTPPVPLPAPINGVRFHWSLAVLKPMW